MELGPVQVLVVGFSGDRFVDEVLPELRRLRGSPAVRLLDLAFVTREGDGRLAAWNGEELSSLDAVAVPGLAATLIGFGHEPDSGDEAVAAAGAAARLAPGLEEETWAIADAIPPGTSAAVALIEHLWAVPLRDAIGRGGGFALEDTWVHPADLLSAVTGSPRDGQ